MFEIFVVFSGYVLAVVGIVLAIYINQDWFKECGRIIKETYDRNIELAGKYDDLADKYNDLIDGYNELVAKHNTIADRWAEHYIKYNNSWYNTLVRTIEIGHLLEEDFIKLKSLLENKPERNPSVKTLDEEAAENERMLKSS